MGRVSSSRSRIARAQKHRVRRGLLAGLLSFGAVSGLAAALDAGSASAVSPSPYINPLRGATGLVPERVDQGVDYDANAGSPIYALGDGVVVLSPTGNGWPGHDVIYKLTSGPAAGDCVYTAEDISPQVSVGQTVHSNTVIATWVNGSNGIETGWANCNALPDALGRPWWHEVDHCPPGTCLSTSYGANFNDLLVALGAPSGIIRAPLQGALPPGWPNWSPAPAAPPRAALASAASGTLMFAVDPSNHIVQESYSSGWHLSGVGGNVRTDSAIATNATGSNVFFFDTANHLSNMFHNATGWHPGTIGGIAGANSGIVATAAGTTVFFTDPAGHLQNAYYNTTGWHIGPIGGSVRPGSSLATNSTGSAVYFIDTANRMSNGYHNATGWHIGTIGGSVSGASGIAASSAGSVFTVDPNLHLQNAYHDATGWHIAAVGGTVRPFAPIATNSAGTAVYYVNLSNQMTNAYRSSTGWRIGPIGGSVRGSTAVSASSTGRNVFYNETDNRIADAYFNSTGWHTAPIGGTTR